MTGAKQANSTPNWKTVLRMAILVGVLAALAYTIYRSWGELSHHQLRWGETHWGILLSAVACAVMALTLSGLYWHRVLIELGIRVPLRRSLRAFYFSQLGKYVPGKALVVVIRSDMIRGPGVGLAASIASTFIETLSWVFVGSQVGALMLFLCFTDQQWLQFLAVAMMLASGVVTLPPLFSRLVQQMSRWKGGVPVSAAHFQLSWRVYFQGIALLGLAWCLSGASLWLVLRALPGSATAFSDYPITLAAASVSMVAGFVSLIPGGLGARELVMIPLLAPQFSLAHAIVGAILIRLVWVAAEILAAATSQVFYRRTVHRE